MIGSKFIARLTAIAALVALGALGLGLDLVAAAPSSVPAAEDMPGDQSLVGDQSADQPAATGEAEDHSPKSPIKVRTIDYQDTGADAGKLKLAGTAAPGTPLYLFFDDEPLAKLVADGEGNWSLERELDLGSGHHTLRAEQYDPTTRMLAGRAMVTIERAAPGSANPEADEAPAKAATPEATTP